MSGIMSMLLGAVSSAAAAVDEFFNLVTLLLPGNGTNGAQNNTFLDSSSNNFTITRNGNTTQGTFSPFSQTGWSNFFDGNDYLTVAGGSSLAFGSGDFSLEAFVYPTASGSAMKIYDGRPNTTAGDYPVLERNASNVAVFYEDATALITGTTVIPANAWTHVLVSRVSGNLRLFINGVQDGSTVSNSINFANGTARPAIAVRGSSLANDFFTGYISNVRVITGSGFTSVTVPTTPLTTVSGTLLLTCQSNRFFDSGTANSGSGFAVTAVGNPSVQAFSPFAPTAAYSAATVGGSGYFDGTGDYLISGATTVGANNFTIEFWIYPTSFAASSYPLWTTSNGSKTDVIAFEINTAGVLVVYVTQAGGGAAWGIISGGNIGTLTRNAWNHVALVRNGTAWRGYVNGVAGGLNTTSSTTVETFNGFSIGAIPNNSGHITGYIAGLREVVGTAVYTAAFTPPTAPPTAITNTSLLVNYTNAGITDATAKNVLETVGNAQISTTQSKFGGSSIYFDGTGDYLDVPSIINAQFGTGDFTIEGWLYINSLAATQVLFEFRAASGASYGQIYITTGGVLRYYLPTDVGTSNTFSTGTWTHFAITRASGTLNMYINGTRGYSASYTSAMDASRLRIGADVSGGSNLNAYIDDLRITKGFARYSGASLTVPTSAFALQ